MKKLTFPLVFLSFLSVEAVMLTGSTSKEESRDIMSRLAKMDESHQEIKLCYVTVRYAIIAIRSPGPNVHDSPKKSQSQKCSSLCWRRSPVPAGWVSCARLGSHRY